MNLLGIVKLNLKLGEMDTTWSFYITREMSHPVLLGWDFVQGNNITIDGAKSEMHMGSSIVQFLLVWKILPRVISASLKETVVIPPRSEMMVAAKLEPVKNYGIVLEEFDGVLEAKDVFKNDTCILVARTAGIVSQGTAPVKLMNVGESEVTFQANTCFRSFYAVVSNDVKVARVGIYETVDSKIEARDVTRSQSCSRVKQVTTVC